jgi:prepilin-type N-terminal cleavage/methylation domain-containing protein
MMKKKFKKSQKGFTLVELSIVLVIIGLIISSVLVGQDLVKAAELRSIVTQYESFNSAVGAFRGKYNGLPGDVAGQTNFGFTGNGDGDGILSTSTDLAGDGAGDLGENLMFWNHLGSTGASLISGSYNAATVDVSTVSATLPSSKVGEYWGVFASAGMNYYVVGVTGGGSGVYLTTAVFTPIEAQGVDEKIDDGRPGRGIVQARGPHTTNADDGTLNTCASAVGGTPIVPTATSTYVTNANATATCTLRIRFNM